MADPSAEEAAPPRTPTKPDPAIPEDDAATAKSVSPSRSIFAFPSTVLSATADALLFPVRKASSGIAEVVGEINGSKQRKREKELSAATFIQAMRRGRLARLQSEELRRQAAAASSKSVLAPDVRPRSFLLALLVLASGLILSRAGFLPAGAAPPASDKGSNPAHDLASKLKFVKRDLRTWKAAV